MWTAASAPQAGAPGPRGWPPDGLCPSSRLPPISVSHTCPQPPLRARAPPLLPRRHGAGRRHPHGLPAPAAVPLHPRRPHLRPRGLLQHQLHLLVGPGPARPGPAPPRPTPPRPAPPRPAPPFASPWSRPCSAPCPAPVPPRPRPLPLPRPPPRPRPVPPHPMPRPSPAPCPAPPRPGPAQSRLTSDPAPGPALPGWGSPPLPTSPLLPLPPAPAPGDFGSARTSRAQAPAPSRAGPTSPPTTRNSTTYTGTAVTSSPR